MSAVIERVAQKPAPASMESLHQFRNSHSPQHVNVGEVNWEYIACGRGDHTLLMLPGGLRRAETFFSYIQMFEAAYRVIVPSYPPVQTIDEMVDGIMTILATERVKQAYVLGQSYGGGLAQVLVRRHPERFTKLVISGAGPLAASRSERFLLPIILAILPFIPAGTLLRWLKNALLKVIDVPETERRFWEIYVERLFAHDLTKADVCSHFRVAQDMLRQRYDFAVGEKSAWPGDVLFIWGGRDAGISAQDRARAPEIYPHVTIQVIENAGHTVGMAAREQYAALVKAFLERQPVETPAKVR